MRPRIIFVVAHDRNGVMGSGGALPWHLPADLRHFQSLTLGKPLVMGRKTYDAIGKPLPGRRNIVLTRNHAFVAPGVEIAGSLEDVWDATHAEPEIAVIGGAEIFRAFAPFVNTAYVTQVDAHVAGDVHYPAPERPVACAVIGEHPADERNAYAMTFLRFDYTEDPDLRQERVQRVIGGSANESNPSG